MIQEGKYITHSPNLMAYLTAFCGVKECDYKLVNDPDNPKLFYMETFFDHCELLQEYKNDEAIQNFLIEFRKIQDKFMEMRDWKKLNQN